VGPRSTANPAPRGANARHGERAGPAHAKGKETPLAGGFGPSAGAAGQRPRCCRTFERPPRQSILCQPGYQFDVQSMVLAKMILCLVAVSAAIPEVPLKNSAVEGLTMPAMGLGTGAYSFDFPDKVGSQCFVISPDRYPV
jgi:hypothetical protein